MQYRIKLSQKRCNMFENEHNDVDDAYSERRPSTVTNAVIASRVNERILAKRHVRAGEIADELDISHGGAHKIIVEHLEFRKVCAYSNNVHWTLDGNSSQKAQKNLCHASRND
ncbi:hypothetical protein AVEN_107288-1 [Araneus ventricosus]|uniref:Uncharacterized protein n=1 Tax=Araneus ventricosus TaxID=182803 RepID=A0A4Y2DS87_ARAVE|nr:hypothetical protein AVEN_107288-1 [Araneus ventricosus]